jgi:hypothetical protein
MKLKFILILSISSLMPAYSHAHDDGSWMVERTAQEQDADALKAQDQARRSARNLLGYENIFGDMRFGDPVVKLGKDRLCDSVVIPDDAYGDDKEPIDCRLNKDYGVFEDIPVFDVEYIFHKINGKYLMTGVNIDLYKSNDDLYVDFYGAPPGKADKSQIISSAAKVSYVVQHRCINVTKRLNEAWGSADNENPVPVWLDTKHGVKASFAGFACNIVTMESLEPIGGGTR